MKTLRESKMSRVKTVTALAVAVGIAACIFSTNVAADNTASSDAQKKQKQKLRWPNL